MAQNSHRLMFRFWLDMFKPEEEEIADTIEILKNERSFSKTIRDGIKLITNLREGKLDVLFELFPWVKAEFMEYVREIQPVASSEPVTVAPAAPPQQVSSHLIPAEQAWLEAEQERLDAERQWHEKRMADAEKALEAERQKIENERSQGQKAIQAQLDRLEQLLLQQGNQPIAIDNQPKQLKPVSGGEGTNIKGIKPLNAPQFSVPTYDDGDDDIFGEVKKVKGSATASLNYLRSMKALQNWS